MIFLFDTTFLNAFLSLIMFFSFIVSIFLIIRFFKTLDIFFIYLFLFINFIWILSYFLLSYDVKKYCEITKNWILKHWLNNICFYLWKKWELILESEKQILDILEKKENKLMLKEREKEREKERIKIIDELKLKLKFKN